MSTEPNEMDREAAQPGTVVTGTFTKETAEDKTGVAVAQKGKKIVISNIIPESLADLQTDLRKGLVVTSINDTEITEEMTSADAAKLLVDAVGPVTIKAVVPEAPKQSSGANSTEPSKSKSSFWCCE